MDGILLIDKPSGLSSFDVIRQLRKKISGEKIGYLGTLDPLATGLLVMFFGRATKTIRHYEESEKEYMVDLELGKSSDTYDSTGIVEEKEVVDQPTQDDLMKALPLFHGQIWQIQPPFSAVHVQGKRAYEWARKGIDLNLGKRQVMISTIECLSYEYPTVKLRLVSGPGTYMRSLVHELGLKLRTGAVMTKLRRVRVGEFFVTDAKSPAEVTEKDLIRTVNCS